MTAAGGITREKVKPSSGREKGVDEIITNDNSNVGHS